MRRTLSLSALGALALILVTGVEGFTETAKSVHKIPEQGENRALEEGEPASSSDILKTCKSFSVFAGTSITFDGPKTFVYSGDIGVSPGTSIEGNYVLKKGSIQVNNDAAKACAEDQLSAFNNLDSQTCTTILPQEDLADLTLTPGVYCSQPGTFTITAGTLTLDAQGDCNALFIFQTDTGITTAEATSFVLINGAQAANVYWKVGTALTLGASSSFVGNILAKTSVSIGSSTSIVGRLLAQAAVTFEGSGEIRLPEVKDEVQCESSPSVSPSTTSRASPSSSSAPSNTVSASASPSATATPSASQSRGPTNPVTVPSSPSLSPSETQSVVEVFPSSPSLFTTGAAASASASAFGTSSSSSFAPGILGTCKGFSIFAGTSMAFNGGLTTIATGNIGVSPGTSITGSYVVEKGTVEINTAAAVHCALDQLIAFDYLNSRTCMNLQANEDLAGLTLFPGVYCSQSGAFSITTATLTLDAQGDSDAEFIFQTDTTVITGTQTSLVLINGANAKNVYWKVGTAMTLGLSSSFVGNVLAKTSISVDTSTAVVGRLLAQAAVTFAGSADIRLPVAMPSSSNAPNTPSNTPSKIPSASNTPSNTVATGTASTGTTPQPGTHKGKGTRPSSRPGSEEGHAPAYPGKKSSRSENGRKGKPTDKPPSSGNKTKGKSGHGDKPDVPKGKAAKGKNLRYLKGQRSS